MNQDFHIGDVLSPQSIERRILLAKPERYSILREHTFDCVLSHRRSFVVDRLLLIRDEEDLKEKGWKIQDHWEKGLTSDPAGRMARFKRYWLDPEFLDWIRSDKQFISRTENFKAAVKSCERKKTPKH